ncbi:MAG: TAXI family TRAP transporter solute-binding subunit [Desulfobacterales bacterium]|nr:TAXI family TRAP transporter solute-binding subunit [Desulfobacterales bacterium]
MKHWSKYRPFFLAAMLAVTLLTPRPAKSANVNLTILGLFPGSSMQQRAEAIAEAIRKSTPYNVTAKTSRPGAKHIMAAANDVNTMVVSLSPAFLSQKVLMQAAPKDIPKFKVSALMPTTMKAFLFFVYKDLPFESLSEMIAKKVPVKMIDGGGSAKLANEILFQEVYGIPLSDVEKWGGKLHHSAGGPAAIPLLQEGQANVHMVYTGGSFQVWEEFNATHPIKFLPVAQDEAELEKVKKALPGFIRFHWAPTRSKLIPAPVPTIGFSEQLWVNPGLDAEVVYNIAKAVIANKKLLISLEPSFATVLNDPVQMVEYTKSDPLVPMHPGAERYYKEQGWIK